LTKKIRDGVARVGEGMCGSFFVKEKLNFFGEN
jgi:hypothetical protein